MEDFKKLNGRPKLTEGKRTKFINVRFTEDEYKDVAALEKQLGITKTDLIRIRVLSDSKNTVINAKELIHHLDKVGAELGKVGNNINQLAKHANILKLQGGLNQRVVTEFDTLFADYIKVQQLLEISLRKIIREMGI